MEMGPVAAVQNKSPAAIAGIEVNDRLMAIDGESVGDPMTLPDRLAAQEIRKIPLHCASIAAEKKSILPHDCGRLHGSRRSGFWDVCRYRRRHCL